MDEEAFAKLEREIEERKRLVGPYEKALGKLSMRFSLLHLVLEEFSWKVWGLNRQVGAILTKDLPTKHLAEKIRDSTELLIATKEVRNELVTILKSVEKIASRRNEFLHSIWFIHEDKPTLCISRKRGQLVGPEAPSVEDINDLSREIMNLVTEFIEIEDGKSLVTRIREAKFGLGLTS